LAPEAALMLSERTIYEARGWIGRSNRFFMSERTIDESRGWIGRWNRSAKGRTLRKGDRQALVGRFA
jgi:hypothetical protein